MLKSDLYRTNKRLIQLYGYEEDGGKRSEYWNNPDFLFPERNNPFHDYGQAVHPWLETKRAFTRQEVIAGSWHKVGDDGSNHGIRFYLGGTLEEWIISQPQNKWNGSWTLEDGVLRANIGEWEMDVVANKTGDIHSGISFQANNPQPYAYYTLTHLP